MANAVQVEPNLHEQLIVIISTVENENVAKIFKLISNVCASCDCFRENTILNY